MIGVNDLRVLYEKKGKSFLNDLLNSYVIVNEQINGSFFGFKKLENGEFRFFKKKGEITYTDRVLSKFYEMPITYIKNLPDDVKDQIPVNMFFGMTYIPLSSTNVEDYNRIPKNRLVLNFIHILGPDNKPKETLQTHDSLDQWADLIGVERPLIIFEGTLDDVKKNKILDYAYGNLSEPEDTLSFTRYLIGILNPDALNKLINSDTVRDINGIIFRFNLNGKDETYLAKVIDPSFDEIVRTNKNIKRQPEDYTWLIVIDLMNHIEKYNLIDIKKWNLNGDSYDKRYVNFINQTFKDFISQNSNKYEGLELNKPDFLKNENFDINTDMIDDEEVKRLINDNDTYKEIYKILLNFFRKKRKRVNSYLFDQNLLKQFNLLVDKIKKILTDFKIYESALPTFNDFIKMSMTSEDLFSIDQYVDKNDNISLEKVNVIVDEFQPYNNGHERAIEKLYKMNGHPVVLIAIVKDNPTFAFPFNKDIVKILLSKVKSKNDIVKDVIYVKEADIASLLKKLRKKYIPILWSVFKNRSLYYQAQFKNLKKRNYKGFELNKDFKIIELPDYEEMESAFEFLKKGDYVYFKNTVPYYIASEFINLRNELDKLNAINESNDSTLNNENDNEKETKEDENT